MNDPSFWIKMHAGATHFPIALVASCVVFDFLSVLIKREPYQRDLRAAGFYALVLGAVSSVAAVLTGLIASGWEPDGSGLLAKHHLFVWPAFVLILAISIWRLAAGGKASERAFGGYLILAGIAAVLLLGAGYWGGEMVLGGSGPSAPVAPIGAMYAPQGQRVAAGQQLFAGSCASCHGPSAQGDFGPSLHRLSLSDAQIEATIRNGKGGGQMPAFGDRLSGAQIQNIVSYLRSLK